MYGSQDASWDIRNGLCSVQWFSRAPECQLSPSKLQTWSCGWRIPSWNASVQSRCCHKSLSPAGKWRTPYQPSSWLWLLSQHRIGGSESAVASRQSCLPPRKPNLQRQFSLRQVLERIRFWDQLPWSRLPAIVFAQEIGIIYWTACIWQVSLDGSCASIDWLHSDDQHLTKWLLLAGLSSGPPEIACGLLRKPFQPHTQGLPLKHESYGAFVRVTDTITLPPGHLLWRSQTSTFSVLKKFLFPGKIAWVHRLVLWGIDQSDFVG